MLFQIRKFITLLCGAISFIYLVGVLNVLQMVSVIIYPLSPKLFRSINTWFARSIWGIWIVMAEKLARMDVKFTGDDIPRGENAVLMCNHQSMADILLIICFAWRCGRLGNLKFFVKDEFKYVPGPGWGMLFLDCIFVKRNWTQDKAGILALFAKFIKHRIPIFLISFLEGTRLTPSKLKSAQKFAEERGLYVPQHTLVPRTKGFVASMHGLNQHIDAVYDLTIGYTGKTPALLDCFKVKVPKVDVHVRRYPVGDLPIGDDDALNQWVFDRYEEKDKLLIGFEETNSFPGERTMGPIAISDWFTRV